MEIKTNELSGPALDWAVCMANGMKLEDTLQSSNTQINLNRTSYLDYTPSPLSQL